MFSYVFEILLHTRPNFTDLKIRKLTIIKQKKNSPRICDELHEYSQYYLMSNSDFKRLTADSNPFELLHVIRFNDIEITLLPLVKS